jgi:hypothetical protein
MLSVGALRARQIVLGKPVLGEEGSVLVGPTQGQIARVEFREGFALDFGRVSKFSASSADARFIRTAGNGVADTAGPIAASALAGY